MKYLLLYVNLLIVFVSGYGQLAIKQSSLAPGGATSTQGSLKLFYTVGESFVDEKQVDNIYLSEGFISPQLLNSLGIENFTELNEAKIFPIPTHNQLTISMPEQGDYQIYIYDLKGQSILHQQIEKEAVIKMDLTDIKSGSYLLLAISPSKKTYFTKKIIKN